MEQLTAIDAASSSAFPEVFFATNELSSPSWMFPANTVLEPRVAELPTCQYTPVLARERLFFRARILSWRRIALASVLQGVVLSHFAGRCRFGEHDAAGMKRRDSRHGLSIVAGARS